MSDIESNIKREKFACRDVIGVRGICDKTYPYNLDLLGISLNKAAKLADSAMITGRELVQESVEFAWEQVMKDLRIDGFLVNGVQKIYKNNFTSDFITGNSFSTSFTRNCDIQRIFFNYISFKVSGTLNVVLSINIDGTTQELFNDDATDETVKVNIDTAISADSITFNITTTGSGNLYSTDDNKVFQYDGYLECSEKLFYCKYWNYLITAAQYKAAAQILNTSLFSDRYNDLIIYKKEEIALRVAQLDNTYNLLNKENQIGKAGLYQLEIENINLRLKQIVKNSKCSCCFECDQFIKSEISIP